MTDYVHNFEGGTDGTTLTTANSGTAPDVAFNTVTGGSIWTFSTTGKIRGALGARVSIGATATAWRAYDQWSAASQVAGRVGFTWNGTVKASTVICGVINSSFAAMMKIVTDGTGKAIVQNAAGTTLATTVAALTAGTAYYVEMQVAAGATGTTDGTIKVQLYAVSAPGTLLLNYAATNVNAGTASTLRGQLGDNSSVASLDLTFDDVLWRPGTLTPVGVPGTNVPPTANAGPDQSVAAGATVTLTGAASSDSDGTITSYAWSLQSNTSTTTPTLSSATAASPTYTAPSDAGGSTQTWLLAVTDNSAASSTDTVTVTVAAPTAPTSPWRISTGGGGSFAAELVITT